jgi:signal transduction histidine kinase
MGAKKIPLANQKDAVRHHAWIAEFPDLDAVALPVCVLHVPHSIFDCVNNSSIDQMSVMDRAELIGTFLEKFSVAASSHAANLALHVEELSTSSLGEVREKIQRLITSSSVQQGTQLLRTVYGLSQSEHYPAAATPVQLTLPQTKESYALRLMKVANVSEAFQFLVWIETTAVDAIEKELAQKIAKQVDVDSDLIVLFNLNGEIVFLNRRASEELGISQQNLSIIRYSDFLTPAGTLVFEQQAGRLTLNGSSWVGGLEFQCPQHQRSQILDVTLRASLSPVTCKPDGFYLKAKPCSPVNELQPILTEQKKIVEELGRLVTLGMISNQVLHDLHLHIQNIGSLDRSAPNGETEYQSLRKKIRQIIQSFYEISRRSTEESHACLKTVMAQVTNLLEGLADSGHIEFLFPQIPENIQVAVDPIHLAQAIVNLFTNSCEAIAHLKERWIELNISLDFDAITMTITDSGNGIPEETANHMFEGFYTTKEHGTGLGLHLSRQMLRTCGGDIHHDPVPPHTTFVVRIPRYRAAASVTPEEIWEEL